MLLRQRERKKYSDFSFFPHSILLCMPSAWHRNPVSYYVCVAITKYHRLGSLSNKHLFFTVLEEVMSKIKMSAWLVSGEGSLISLQMAAFLLYPNILEGEIHMHLSLSLLIKPYQIKALPLWSYLTLITSYWPYFQILSCWRLGFQHMD
jgi:hypothetical protein